MTITMRALSAAHDKARVIRLTQKASGIQGMLGNHLQCINGLVLYGLKIPLWNA